MTPYETIRLAGGILSPGTSVRGLCPFCRGGRTKEESFLITRRGGDLVYTCFRASCGGRSNGVLSIHGDPSAISPVKKKETEHLLWCETYPLSKEARGTLLDMYQLTPAMLDYYGLAQTKDGDIVIPIYSSRGLIQGHERRIRDRTRAKAIRYNGMNSDGMGWYNTTPRYILPPEYVPQQYRNRKFLDDCLFIVEDLYSAMKANAVVHSVALLGTNMSPEKAALIAQMGYRQVLLALDADATHKAAALARRYRGLLPELRVIPLHSDIKNTPYSQVVEIIYTHAIGD